VTDRLGFPDALKQVFDASVRYYEGIGRLTLEYWRASLTALGDLPLPKRTGTGAERPAGGGAEPNAGPTRNTSPSLTPAMVLEAEAGAQAVGVFLVENRLPRKVSAPVVGTAFVDEKGREVRPVLRFEPEVVTLEPGEQVLVRVAALVDQSLEPETSYRGEVTVPGLTGGRVRLVLRQRRSHPEPASPPVPPAANKPTRGAKRRRGHRRTV
jgi:hypothetical protein